MVDPISKLRLIEGDLAVLIMSHNMEISVLIAALEYQLHSCGDHIPGS